MALSLADAKGGGLCGAAPVHRSSVAPLGARASLTQAPSPTEVRRYPTSMDRPPADQSKLLPAWMEWEKGESSPGDVLKIFKINGMREILEALDAAIPTEDESS